MEFTCEAQPDYVDDTTTHLISSDCGAFSTVMTKQIVQACVRHVFISSIDWILLSLQQSFVLDQFPFEILRDRTSPADSRGIKQCRFDYLPVFPSSCVLSVECSTGIEPLGMSRDELIDLVDLTGATLLNEYIDCKTLIVICNSKSEMIARRQQDEDQSWPSNEKTIHYCSPDFLFDSIVRHEVQSLEPYAFESEPRSQSVRSEERRVGKEC